MFVSFFPRPKLFFWSAAVWTLFAVLFWFFVARNAGGLIGLENPPEGTPPIIGVSVFWSKPFLWFYIYCGLVVGLFAAFWQVYSPHPWFAWSVLGSALIVFSTYTQVQIGVAINAWYGPFYDLLQAALAKTRETTAAEFYFELLTFTLLASLSVVVFAATRFFVSHYVFRWRHAMNDYYMAEWVKLRNVEGASQRVQEDTMRFARLMENLGANFIDSIMTIISFLPILLVLSSNVTELPVVGTVPYPLVAASIAWAAFGTGALALLGIKLPGLEFLIQRTEAAYRKELVYGEDDADRASPPTVAQLFSTVRRSYFRLYFHYLYFNAGWRSYQQADNIFPMLILVPSVVAGKLTLGPFQQILNAFNQVRESFLYLVNRWHDIVELLSIYKRLRAFEATLEGSELPAIDQEYMAGNQPA